MGTKLLNKEYLLESWAKMPAFIKEMACGNSDASKILLIDHSDKSLEILYELNSVCENTARKLYYSLKHQFLNKEKVLYTLSSKTGKYFVTRVMSQTNCINFRNNHKRDERDPMSLKHWLDGVIDEKEINHLFDFCEWKIERKKNGKI